MMKKKTVEEPLAPAVCSPLFVYRGEGHYMGSCVIVCAETIQSACAMIRRELDARGLEHVSIGQKDSEVVRLNPKPGDVIYVDDGDY
jgi:hypothetical protein